MFSTEALSSSLGSSSVPYLESDDEMLFYHDSSLDHELTLEEFCIELPKTIRMQGEKSKDDHDMIAELFRRLSLDKDEWDRFAFFDPLKNYTRNLIATDNETYTLLLLCWTPNRESPIHDHPCDGCWLRVCEGVVRETRYVQDENEDVLKCVEESNFEEGQQAYIEDSMGYHKIGNPSIHKPAVTLHLYSPPFQKCKIWLDPCKASNPSVSCFCMYSEYGIKV